MQECSRAGPNRTKELPDLYEAVVLLSIRCALSQVRASPPAACICPGSAALYVARLVRAAGALVMRLVWSALSSFFNGHISSTMA